MKRVSFLLLILLSLTQWTYAQNTRHRGAQSLGFGVQIYPAGTIFNIKSAWAVSAKGELIGKLGYNIAQRENFGEHDSEEGNGPGLPLHTSAICTQASRAGTSKAAWASGF
ncbi:MAG: hypothetical protein HEP71_14545 [Roseivirga sp.]|nr:hypothetical protein [Roseivirga sp.]